MEAQLRENFEIGHPTPAYRALLQAAPLEFVGAPARLRALVEVLSAGVAATFAAQVRPRLHVLVLVRMQRARRPQMSVSWSPLFEPWDFNARVGAGLGVGCPLALTRLLTVHTLRAGPAAAAMAPRAQCALQVGPGARHAAGARPARAARLALQAPGAAARALPRQP